MTAYATRAPLQLINNPHMMSEHSRGGRRRSSRLEDKEDAPYTNGIVHDPEPIKGRQNTTVKQGRANANSVGAKAVPKRKAGESPEYHAEEDMPAFGAPTRNCWEAHQRNLTNWFIAFDEEVDGFAFTRTRSKKAKADAVPASTPEEPRQEEQAQPVPIRKSQKKATSSPSAAPVEKEEKVAKRRSARHSGEHENSEPPALPVKKRRRDRTSSELKPDHGGEGPQTDKERVRQEPQQDQLEPVEVSFDATKIALPFADTPIIRRNKEMRKTNAARRSSLGMRGRRASSLIDAGKSNGNDCSFAVTLLILTPNQPCLMMKSRARNSISI